MKLLNLDNFHHRLFRTYVRGRNKVRLYRRIVSYFVTPLREIRRLHERLDRMESDQARLIKRFDVTLAIYEQRIDNIDKKLSEFVSKSQ